MTPAVPVGSRAPHRSVRRPIAAAPSAQVGIPWSATPEHLPVARVRPTSPSSALREKATVIPATVNSVDSNETNLEIGLFRDSHQLAGIPSSTPLPKELGVVPGLDSVGREIATKRCPHFRQIRAGRGLVVNDVTSRSDIAPITTPLPVGPPWMNQRNAESIRSPKEEPVQDKRDLPSSLSWRQTARWLQITTGLT